MVHPRRGVTLRCFSQRYVSGMVTVWMIHVAREGARTLGAVMAVLTSALANVTAPLVDAPDATDARTENQTRNLLSEPHRPPPGAAKTTSTQVVTARVLPISRALHLKLMRLRRH